ncbi:MAG TPA: tRNA preQ1(34) S-adenosylmethionine ribosyltransferase-isomerase QueA, partial [Dissulfurispiraceae bacterium]|nr:tRNA preQ1(34) S-adenosylmethionine ribosyltransferase-isomerase QueA [Dissulfurispiraceae bacterium]
MRTADFDFDLPPQLIASRPSEMRDHSQLLVLHRDGYIEHKRFFDVLDYLEEGDMILMNNTKVFPARIIGKRRGGRTVDILLVRETADKSIWEILCKGPCVGPVTVLDGIDAEIETHYSGKQNGEKRYLRIPEKSVFKLNDLLWKYGYMPLPPYIKRMPEDADKERYQTVYAEKQGSIAAPTAGLHFTDDLIAKIQNKGVFVRFLTLHVGTGTFKPVRAEFLEDHNMDSEYFEMDPSIIQEFQQVKKSGRKVIAVGTTTTRTLEGLASGKYRIYNELNCLSGPLLKSGLPETGSPRPLIKGVTDIFIYPGYSFKAVDCLITNFHLPRSTPF